MSFTKSAMKKARVIKFSDTEECKLGFYDGNIIQTIKGLIFKGQMIVAKFFSWRLERANIISEQLEFCI